MKRIITLACLLVCAVVSAQDQTVRFFSHRGGRQEFDQNTISAFEASYQAGYRGYETDVRLTRDGKLVILHDSNFKKLFGIDAVVEKMTEAEIRKIKTKEGNDILFLDELMDWIDSKGDITYVEFELKSSPRDLYPQDKLEELAEKVYKRVMRKKPAGATYLITSSDYRGLRYLQQAHPGVEMLAITGKPCNDETIALCKALGIDRLGATIEGTSREAVKKAHKAGIIVSLWPGNNPDDAVLGVYLGADYLCTDVPVAVKKHMTEHFPWVKAIY